MNHTDSSSCGSRVPQGILGLLVLVSATLLSCYPSMAQQQDQAITFSTYLGGGQDDQVRDVAVDSEGAVIVTGGSSASDYPTQPNSSGYVYDATPNGSYDVIATKFAADGSLLWSTVIGGAGYDRAYAVDVDGQDNIYIAGRAGFDFPVTPGTAQSAFRGGRANPGDPYGEQDGFVCKLDPAGAVLFCTFFGGSDGLIVRDVAVDASGSIYLAAAYLSGTYPSAVASAFLNGPSGNQDAVLAKIAADGSRVVWARYLGGSAWESNENSVGVDDAGNPYILITTKSSNLATAGAYDTTYAGGSDVFVTKCDPNGNVVWGTYLGGPQNESTETHELGVSGAGNSYVAVPTKSTFSSIPGSSGTRRLTYGPGGGNNDMLVAELSTDGTRVEALTFLGGNGSDRPEGVVAAGGDLYITGVTTSTDFPLTANALQSSDPTAGMAIVLKLNANLERVYAGFHGGSARDSGRGAAADGSGRFYIAGWTKSDDFLLANAEQTSWGGLWDGFVAAYSQVIAGTCLADCGLCDADGDGLMNGVELAWIGRAFTQCSATPSTEWWAAVDYDGNGCIDGGDLAVLSGPGVWGRSTASCSAPTP